MRPLPSGFKHLRKHGIALQTIGLHAGRGPARYFEILDEGKIARVLEAELVVPAVIPEYHAVHHERCLISL